MKKVLLSFFFLLSSFIVSQTSFAAASSYECSFTPAELKSMTPAQFRQLPDKETPYAKKSKAALAKLYEDSETLQEADDLYSLLDPNTKTSVVNFYRGNSSSFNFDFSSDGRSSQSIANGIIRGAVVKGFGQGLVLGTLKHAATAGIGTFF